MMIHLREKYSTKLSIFRSFVASIILTLQIVFLFAGWEQEAILLNSKLATMEAKIQGGLIVFQTPFAITISFLIFIETWVNFSFNLARVPLALGSLALIARVTLTGFKEDLKKMGTGTEDYEVISIFLLINVALWLLLERFDTELKFNKLTSWPFNRKEESTMNVTEDQYHHIKK